MRIKKIQVQELVLWSAQGYASLSCKNKSCWGVQHKTAGRGLSGSRLETSSFFSFPLKTTFRIKKIGKGNSRRRSPVRRERKTAPSTSHRPTPKVASSASPPTDMWARDSRPHRQRRVTAHPSGSPATARTRNGQAPLQLSQNSLTPKEKTNASDRFAVSSLPIRDPIPHPTKSTKSSKP